MRPGRAEELFDFTLDERALSDHTLAKQKLDPDLGMFRGPQFPKDGRAVFGVFNASTGASYLELVEIIASQGAAPREDLVELWSRIVFNIMVSNTDDHLRNHGFLLVPGAGWRLSPAYDMNAVPGSSGLSLNVDESDNALDLALVRSVAPYFRLKDAAAEKIIDRMAGVVRQLRATATSLGIKRSEQNDMADAFKIRESL